MNKNIKAVVFDFGGVVEIGASDIMSDISEAVGVPVDELREEYFKHNHISTVENEPWEKVIEKTVEAFNVSGELKEKVLQIVETFRESRRINTELLDIFKALKKKNFKVAIFSNNTSGLRSKLSEKGIMDLIDDAIISAEIGFQKPHKEAFDVLFERLGVRPEEVVFIDDTPKSLEKAEEIGYIPILFKNNDQLRTDLEKLGIEVDEISN